jgi:hypothetical protein
MLNLKLGIENWFVQRGSRPIIAATVSVTPDGVTILRRARFAGTQRIPLESEFIGPMQYP